MFPLNAAICTTISYTLWVEWYYIKNNYLTLKSKVKVPWRSLRYVTHCLMVLHIWTFFQWTVLLDLFDLEVKGQGPTKVITVLDTPLYGHAPTYQLSLTYLERQKCYGPDKKILFNFFYLTLRSKVKVPRRSLWYATHRLMVMYIQTISMNSFVGIIWPWGQRSRSHKGHYGTRHTALWSCTHMPIIIDLSRKTKMLWPGQENTI